MLGDHGLDRRGGAEDRVEQVLHVGAVHAEDVPDAPGRGEVLDDVVRDSARGVVRRGH